MAAYPAHSLIAWRSAQDGPGDTAGDVLAVVLERLRALNREDGARELSLAITHIEEAQHWLRALADRTGRST